MLFPVLPAIYLQRYFYSLNRPQYFNFAALGMEIAKVLIRDLVDRLDPSALIFKNINGDSFMSENQDVLNLLLRSKCAAIDYVEAGGEVRMRHLNIQKKYNNRSITNKFFFHTSVIV